MVTKKTPVKKPSVKKPSVKKPSVKKTVKATNEKTVKKPVAAKAAKVDFNGLSPKEVATAKGEPWINVVSVELDPENIGNGAFELDFNDIFVARLYKAGYQGKTDHDVVDRWFTDVCRNVLAENYEQWEANQPVDARPREMGRRDLGDGRTEVE